MSIFFIKAVGWARPQSIWASPRGGRRTSECAQIQQESISSVLPLSEDHPHLRRAPARGAKAQSRSCHRWRLPPHNYELRVILESQRETTFRFLFLVPYHFPARPRRFAPVVQQFA